MTSTISPLITRVPLSTDTSISSFVNPAIARDSLYVSSSNLRRSYGGYDCEFTLCAVLNGLTLC